MYREVYFLLVLIGAVAVTSLLFMLPTKSPQTSLVGAQTPGIVTEPAIYGESSPSMLAKLVAKNKHLAKDPNVEIDVKIEPDALLFTAKNVGKGPAVLDVDKWISQFSKDELVLHTEKAVIDASLPAFEVEEGKSVTVKSFDLTAYSDLFEDYPGSYTLNIWGLRWSDELQGNDVAYSLEAIVDFSYDEDKILSNPHRLLKADGMQMSVEGTGDTFAVQAGSPKKVTFYLYNDQEKRVSGLMGGFDVLVWNTQNRTNADGHTTIMETPGANCTYLGPGERVSLGTYDFSTTSWPIASNGISSKFGVDTVVPGLYIVNVEVYTRNCSLDDGEEVEGGTSSLIAAFEVK